MADSLPPHEVEQLPQDPATPVPPPGYQAKYYSTQTSYLSDLPSDPTHVDYADEIPQPPPPPPQPGSAADTKESPKYLSPFHRYLNQLELWKFFSVLLAIFALGATLHNYGSISRRCMISVATLLVVAVFSFIVAHDLQERHPKIADGGIIIGVASLVSSFHIVALAFLHLPLELLVPAILVLIVLYSSLVVYHFYPIIRVYVHKQEKIKQVELDGAGDSLV